MNKLVAVIDDQFPARQELGLFLIDEGYSVVEADSGEGGLKLVANNPGIVVIFTDFHMPGMNGLEMCEELKKQGSKIPVCMVTTEMSRVFKNRGREANVKFWIQKPIDFPRLSKAVKSLLP